jgi:hypothetical protein
MVTFDDLGEETVFAPVATRPVAAAATDDAAAAATDDAAAAAAVRLSICRFHRQC